MIPNKSVSALESLLDVDLYTPAPTAAATVSTEQRVMKELKKYMDAGPNGLSCDPFKWWSVNAGDYQLLSQLAKCCLITPSLLSAIRKSFQYCWTDCVSPPKPIATTKR